MSALITFLGQILGFVVNFFEQLPLLLMGPFLDGVNAFLQALPVPSFFGSAAGFAAAIPPAAAFFLQGFQIVPGLTIVFSAYTIRFVIRRIFFIN